MTDPIAMNANETSLDNTDLLVSSEIANGARPRQVRAARLVSNILAPTTISVPMILLVAFYQASNIGHALGYAGLTLFFLSIGPFLYILLNVRLGKLSDVDVSKRTERVGLFIFALLSVCVGWFVLILTHAPNVLITVVFMTAISGLIMMITTLWWKISIHASSLAGAATVLTVLYGAIMLPSFILLAMVCWSRVVLRRHTVAQVIAGSLLSIVLATVILKLRGV
jgi:membrane-associated phospholipid phosphatase